MTDAFATLALAEPSIATSPSAEFTPDHTPPASPRSPKSAPSRTVITHRRLLVNVRAAEVCLVRAWLRSGFCKADDVNVDLEGYETLHDTHLVDDILRNRYGMLWTKKFADGEFFSSPESDHRDPLTEVLAELARVGSCDLGDVANPTRMISSGASTLFVQELADLYESVCLAVFALRTDISSNQKIADTAAGESALRDVESLRDALEVFMRASQAGLREVLRCHDEAVRQRLRHVAIQGFFGLEFL